MIDHAKSSGPGLGTETATKNEFAAQSNSTAQPRQNTVGERIRQADSALGCAIDALVTGDISVADLWRYSPNAAGLFNLGYGYGYESREEELRQARHDADRMALFAMNGPERATEIQARLDARLASMPDGIEIWSPEWVEQALSGVFAGGAA